jgi:hypothetical protein
MREHSFFLDSGAYSAMTRKVNIDIDQYIEFIKKNKKYLDVYANLDVIGDADGGKSYENWKYMKSKGLDPLPVYHAHADPKYLQLYIKETDYIAIGAISEMNTKQRLQSLDKTWRLFLLDSKGFPKVKCHGFGLTASAIMSRYPWYSVDSMSWSLMSAYGSVYVPFKKNGVYDYQGTPGTIFVSTRSPAVCEEGAHLSTLPYLERKAILDYFEEKGFRLGKSETKKVKPGYQLQENEEWIDIRTYQVEITIEKGLINNYKDRAAMNVVYFQDFERNQPSYPWAVKLDSTIFRKGFGLER